MIRSLFGIVTASVLLAAGSANAQQKRGEKQQEEPAVPPNMCRIWLDGVRPERQPAPTDCATALRNKPPNGRVIFGKQSVDTPRRPWTPPDTAKAEDPKRKRPKPKKPD